MLRSDLPVAAAIALCVAVGCSSTYSIIAFSDKVQFKVQVKVQFLPFESVF
jgi:hypothetical protein